MAGLPDASKEFEAMRASRVVRDQEIAKKGDVSALNAPAPILCSITGPTTTGPIPTASSLSRIDAPRAAMA